MKSVLLTGAKGVVGYPLSQRLTSEGVTNCRVSRSLESGEGNDTIQWDMQSKLDTQLLDQLKQANIDTVIHCSPIWLLPNHLHDLLSIGVHRIIAFSSSSVTSKQASSDSSEHVLVKQLMNAEGALNEFCETHNIDLTIFRPSMIYGYARDQNITHIAKFIKRYGFMALTGQANGLRQPVHADDLVEATLSALENSNSVGKTYVLAGGTELTYRDMVLAIFDGLNKRPKIISIPLVLLRLALKIATWVGRFSYTPEMANRMNQNLSYDISEAKQDFSYNPQAFLTQPERDLP